MALADNPQLEDYSLRYADGVPELHGPAVRDGRPLWTRHL